MIRTIRHCVEAEVKVLTTDCTKKKLNYGLYIISGNPVPLQAPWLFLLLRKLQVVVLTSSALTRVLLFLVALVIGGDGLVKPRFERDTPT